MSKNLSCFVVAPIGETGSDIRQDSDDLLDLIIKPALEVFGIDVIRGDHRNESGQIDVDVIKLVQESDLCIVDLSLENVNVYYELGRRDETGKPIILLKSSSSQKLPIDIATRRYIEFNLDDRRAIISSRDKIKEAVQTFIDNGMERTKGTSLFAISEKIDRIERNLARLIESRNIYINSEAPLTDEWDAEDPSTLIQLALLEKNIPMAEYAMDKLQYSMDEISFYDVVVEQVAAILGSKKAGEMLIDYMETFMDSVDDVNKKIEYFGCVVSYLNRTDQELKYINIVEKISLKIRNSDNEITDGVYNQLNRLYHGIYVSTKEDSYINKAISYLMKAIEANPSVASYYYNLALCYDSKKDNETNSNEKTELIKTACEFICKAIELDGENYDEDHIVLACRLFHMIDNTEWLDYLDMLKKISPNRAKLLKRELK